MWWDAYTQMATDWFSWYLVPQLSSCWSWLVDLLLWRSVWDKGWKTAWFNWKIKGVNFQAWILQLVDKEWKDVSLVNKQSKLAGMQTGYNQKFFPFVSLLHLPTVYLFFPFLLKRGITIIYFWTQKRSQCPSATTPFKPHYSL
jgi:hypothetical protein